MRYFHLVVLGVLLSLEAGIHWCPHKEAVAAMKPLRTAVLFTACGVSLRDLFKSKKD